MHSLSSISKAIVTGHSRGLGAAIAEQLLERGIAVLGISRRQNANLANRFGAALTQAELDLSDSGQLAQWLADGPIARFLNDAGRAFLFNNAGVAGLLGPLADVNARAIAAAVSVNVAAPLMLSAAFAAASDTATDRRIVHISSGAGRQAFPGMSVYSATKAALDHHARSAALDGDRTLRISSVAPGVIDTDMQAELRSTDLARFPLRERFDVLKRDGLLATPAESARKLVDHVMAEAFGQAAIVDIRDLA
jgi:NAD(P)-dependent dehydrogenase (short-subunit alcohol dehydrogenase family)